MTGFRPGASLGATFGVAMASVLLMAMAPTGLPPAPSATEAPRDFDTRIAEIAGRIDANDSAAALAALDALLPTVDLPAQRGTIEGLRSFALARLGRLPEARKAAEAAIAATPAPTMLLLRQLFLTRAFDGDQAAAADAVALITATYPRGARELPSELLFQLLTGLRKDEQKRFDLAYSLAAVDWEPEDGKIGDGDGVRLLVLTGLASRGRLDEAAPIVEKVQDPGVLLRLGIDRRFAPLWPAVEARLGPGARTASEAFVAAAKARFEAAPNSMMARHGYAQALNIAAREPEAVAVLADVAPTPADLARLNNREIWVVNLQADLLANTGRIDAGLARLNALNAGLGDARPELISTAINAALLAESADRPEAALAAIAAAETGAKFASDYGKAFIANARACVLARTGKRAEAIAAAAPVLAQTDNQSARMATQICLGQTDAAAATLIKRLQDAEDGTDMVFELQPFLIADRPGVPGNAHRAALRGLKARADVKAAFLKAGRDLPAAVSPPR